MIIPNSHKTFHVPRDQMPQIESAHVKDFLKSIGHPYDIELVPTKDLIPTQGEFNFDKVKGMDVNSMCKPILVSEDNYVLDGHHRWLANHNIGDHVQPVIRINMPAVQALEAMGGYEKTFSKSIHEEGGEGGGAMTSGGDSAPTVSIANKAMDNEVVAIPGRYRGRSFKMFRRKKRKD